METSINSTLYHSAIPSWSGFQYQGKVALIVVLDCILKLSSEEYQDYFLELEHLEDFSILKGDIYVSIHQVKSYKSRSLSEYTDAIWNLLGKAMINSCNHCYLHSTTDIDDEETIKKKLKPPKVSSNSHKNNIIPPSKYYSMIKSNNAYDDLFKKFSRYIYLGKKKYCPLTEVEDEIKERIKQYYVKIGKTHTPTQIDAVYHYLLGELDKHVAKRHIMEQIKDGCYIRNVPDRIEFKKIVEVLEENWEDPSEEYVILRLRNIFHSTSEKMLEELYLNMKEEESKEELDDLGRVEKYVREIGELNNHDFLTFCQIVTPNIHIIKANIDAYRDLIPTEGIEVLVSIFYEIKRELDTNKYMYIVRDQFKNICYLPTTLKLFNGRIKSEERKRSEIARGILKNSAIRNQLFEVEVMITNNINAESLEEAAMKFTEVDDGEMKRNDKITKIKKIRLIDIDKAKGELQYEQTNKEDSGGIRIPI